jgi:hypothetical protein
VAIGEDRAPVHAQGGWESCGVCFMVSPTICKKLQVGNRGQFESSTCIWEPKPEERWIEWMLISHAQEGKRMSMSMSMSVSMRKTQRKTLACLTCQQDKTDGRGRMRMGFGIRTTYRGSCVGRLILGSDSRLAWPRGGKRTRPSKADVLRRKGQRGVGQDIRRRLTGPAGSNSARHMEEI